MADRAQLRRMRQALIRTGVADETTTDDELEERAAFLMMGMETFARAMRPAISIEGALTSHSPTSKVLYVLADLAKEVEDARS